ncbi:MAG: hypothetical protein GY880_25795 [Planctomycetaceae bacterium]|nr:hypothetical protein [Planctomycetaceae bacterium]MCP4476780.1 hypothetical protein [Planctomycetaceae bacterium]MCP4777648.1 hypothetical protein [Planctomycetaceae bacterium]
MNDETHTLPFHHDDHGTHETALTVRDLDDDYLLSCKLPTTGEVITAQAADCYAALQGIRRKTEGRGWSIHCLGARRNVWPSAMSRQMGGGEKAYQLNMGQQATEIVCIFDADSNPDGSSVAEQEAYSQNWLKSLG